MICALSVSMKMRSPAAATPRLKPVAALPATPLVRGRWKCQIMRPLPASSAQHSLALETYITPSTTTGVFSTVDTFAIGNIHFGAMRATLLLSICVSFVYRLPLGSPL